MVSIEKFNIENELVHQKDAILTTINEGQIEKAVSLLQFAKELWYKCSYGYKFEELKQRLENECNAHRGMCAHWKTHEAWERRLNLVRSL